MDFLLAVLASVDVMTWGSPSSIGNSDWGIMLLLASICAIRLSGALSSLLSCYAELCSSAFRKLYHSVLAQANLRMLISTKWSFSCISKVCLRFFSNESFPVALHFFSKSFHYMLFLTTGSYIVIKLMQYCSSKVALCAWDTRYRSKTLLGFTNFTRMLWQISLSRFIMK